MPLSDQPHSASSSSDKSRSAKSIQNEGQMEDDAWTLSLSDKAGKMISNSDLHINADGENCFALHCMANTHTFQEHVLGGKREYSRVYFLHTSQSKGWRRFTALPRTKISAPESLNVAAWWTGKAKYTQNCSFVFEGFYADKELGLLWGLRQISYETALQWGVCTEGYGPCQTCWTFPLYRL